MKLSYLTCLMPVFLASSAMAVTTINGVTLEAISGLSESSTYATWNTLNSTTVGGSFPGFGSWSPVAAQSNVNDASSQLVKVSSGSGGGAYGATTSLYYGGFTEAENISGGVVAISSDAPMADLQTVIFQIQVGEVMGYDFYNDAPPTLSYTLAGDPTVYTIGASETSIFDRFENGSFSAPGGEQPLYVNSYAMWFDLSSVSGDIDSYDVEWNAVQHGQVFGVSVQQDNVALADGSILPAAVPEPATTLLGAVGALIMLRRRR